MSEAIRQTKTRYSKKCDQPESRKFHKFAHAANLNSTDNSDEGPEVVDKEVANLDQPDSSVEGNEVEPKWEFYSGHRHYHLMNTQLIVYSLGNIVFLQAGFLGSMNDASNFHLMERIVPGTNYDMPHGAALLADKGYGDVAPLLTPFRIPLFGSLGTFYNI